MQDKGKIHNLNRIMIEELRRFLSHSIKLTQVMTLSKGAVLWTKTILKTLQG